jgi:biotin transport system substrate-specific component
MNEKTQRVNSKTVMLTMSALFVALTAICSWISIPVPGTSVPINLATFAVLLAGIMLGRKYGAAAMTVFLLLGAVGVPVFHGFTGGLGVITGPTGGFLIGYIAMAAIAGFHRDCSAPFIPVVIIGEVVLYAIGVIWFILMMHSTLKVALVSCVLPFIPGDIVKIVLVYLVKNALNRAL